MKSTFLQQEVCAYSVLGSLLMVGMAFGIIYSVIYPFIQKPRSYGLNVPPNWGVGNLISSARMLGVEPIWEVFRS
jgi:hypothetical protein